jgi:hypothetical protein
VDRGEHRQRWLVCLDKGLWLTALLYTVYIALSVLGWRAWQRKL